MTRDEAIEKITQLADELLGDAPAAAIVLLTLSGSMHMYADVELATLCQYFAKRQKDVADAAINERKATLN